MNRRRSLLLRTLITISSLLCLITATLWIMSVVVPDSFCRTRMWNDDAEGRKDWHWHFIYIYSEDGMLTIDTERGRWTNHRNLDVPPKWTHFHGNHVALMTHMRLDWNLDLATREANASRANGNPGFTRKQHHFGIRYWFPTTIFALSPLIAFWRRRPRAGHEPGEQQPSP